MTTPPPDAELDPFQLVDWGMLAALALIWGSSFLFISIGLEHFTPAQVAFLRITLGALTLLTLPAARRGVDRADLPRIAVLGLLWVGIPFMLFPLAQQWVDTSVAGMINGGMPLWAALVATIIARRLPPGQVGVGLLAGFAGILLISLPTLEVGGSTAQGAGLILLATILYGVSLNLAVPLQRRYGGQAVMLRAQATAAVFTLPFAAAGWRSATWGVESVLAISVLGVFGTGIALVVMATLAGRVGAARGSIAIYLVPIVAIVLGAVFRGETIHPAALLGTALVIGGAWITSRSQRPVVTPGTPEDAEPEPDPDAAEGAAPVVA